MHCPHCDREHPDDSQFCPRTGKKITLPSLCPGCGQTVDPTWRYCKYCGSKLIKEVEQPKPPEPKPVVPSQVDTLPLTNNARKKRLWIVVAVIAVLVIAVVAWDISTWRTSARNQAATLTAMPPTPTKAPTRKIVLTEVILPSPTVEVILPSPTVEIIFPSPTVESILPEPAGGTQEWIAFTTIRDGNLQIYLMHPDGSAQTRISNNSFNDSDPGWSPDGKKIVFISTRASGWGIYVMNADGSSQTQLTGDPGASGPAWSPDGQRIAFALPQDGQDEIYTMNADGTGQTRLTENSNRDASPAWSPDGNKIAFVSDRDGSDEIYVMNADGTGQTRLTSNYALDGSPDWSPDGRMIAFNSNRDGIDQIFSMNADGSAQTRLTDNRATYQYPNWSADGNKIAYVSLNESNTEIFVMNANGSAPVQVTNNNSIDFDPEWGPNPAGAYILPTPQAQVQGLQVVDAKAGIAFTVPEGLDLYSEANPGPLRSQISAKEPYILVNPGFTDENINIIITGPITESDLAAYKDSLESETFTMPVPAYKKISVAYIHIGKNGNIQAVDHRFQMQGNVLGTMRSITFIINGRGYVITCGTAVERFDQANQEFFDPFLNSIEPAQ